jgi:hypothetical protein
MIPSGIRTLGLAALAAALVACGDRRPAPPKMAEVLPNVPLPPQARFVGSAGGEDALQFTVESPLPRAEIEAFYRGALNRNGWKLVNQAKDPDGALVFFAEQDGPPLWVRVRSAADTTASLVEFSGARVGAGKKPAS